MISNFLWLTALFLGLATYASVATSDYMKSDSYHRSVLMAIVALGRNIHSDHCTEFLYLDLHMTDLIGYRRHFSSLYLVSISILI